MSVLDFDRTRTTAILASPAAAVETVIASLPAINLKRDKVVDAEGTCDVTIGTGGVTATLRVRRGTLITHPLIAAFGPFTIAAGNRVVLTIGGLDRLDVERYGLIYSLTLTVASASTQSTVNNVYMGAYY